MGRREELEALILKAQEELDKLGSPQVGEYCHVWVGANKPEYPSQEAFTSFDTDDNGTTVFVAPDGDHWYEWERVGKTFIGYVARDADEELFFYTVTPSRDLDKDIWRERHCLQLPDDLLPNLTWNDEPLEIRI